MGKSLTNYLNYRKFFNQSALWTKISEVAKKAGQKVIYWVLVLFYVATDPKTPMADKAKIYGALGYFILPLDLIPDAVALLGYTDDLAAITWAVKAVWRNITPEVQSKAKEKLTKWFGKVNEAELKLLP